MGTGRALPETCREGGQGHGHLFQQHPGPGVQARPREAELFAPPGAERTQQGSAPSCTRTAARRAQSRSRRQDAPEGGCGQDLAASSGAHASSALVLQTGSRVRVSLGPAARLPAALPGERIAHRRSGSPFALGSRRGRRNTTLQVKAARSILGCRKWASPWANTATRVPGSARPGMAPHQVSSGGLGRGGRALSPQPHSKLVVREAHPGSAFVPNSPPKETWWAFHTV